MGTTYRLAVLSLFALLFAAFPLLAETPYSMTPSIGPTAGGTEVTIKGDFGSNPIVVFGFELALTTTRIDDHTLIAITPPQLPGTVDVTIFMADGLPIVTPPTGLTFTFFGGIPPAFERVLLPIFTPPVHGAFGSEFHTDLRIANRGTGMVSFYGLHPPCPFAVCDELPANVPFQVEGGETIGPADVKTSGNPGQFLWVKKDIGAALSMNLRVHDVTRDDLNFGTEIPIVNDSEWVNDRIVFLGVRNDDPRFRNTLRIYGQFPFTALVKIGDREPVRVPLSETHSLFDVPYAVFVDFPSSPFLERVTIEAEQNLILPIVPIEVPMWAMITVTNNETQAISTITPQP
jgi:hypothetical protein